MQSFLDDCIILKFSNALWDLVKGNIVIYFSWLFCFGILFKIPSMNLPV